MTKVGFRQKSAAGDNEIHAHIETYTNKFVTILDIAFQVKADKICPKTLGGTVIVK